MNDEHSHPDAAAVTDEITERRRRAFATVEVCRDTIFSLLNDRQMFGHFADAVNASVAVRQTWFPTAVARWYSQSSLVALRRLGDRDQRTNSLRVLFDEMIASPDAWSFDSVLQVWAADDKHKYPPEMLRFLLESTYSAFVFGTGHELLVERVVADRDRLKSELQHVKTLVDKEIAHAERGWEPLRLTFEELNAAVDAVHELARPYVTLITGAGFPGDMTPIETYPWWKIFNSWPSVPPFFPESGGE